MFQETKEISGDQGFAIGSEEIVLDEPEAPEGTYNIDSLKEMIKSGKIDGLDLDKFDNYLKFHEKIVEAILAEINRVATEKRNIEATRKLNQLAFDIAKSRI